MAFSTSGITEVFPGATVSGGDLTLVSGSINSFTPSSATEPGVYEMCFGLLDTMAEAVATGSLQNITVATNQSLIGTTLTKNYNFTVKLAFDGDSITPLLDVIAEPTG